MQVKGYIDPGSAAIFLQKEVAKRLPIVDVQPLPKDKFKGAVEGKAKYSMRVQLVGRKRGAWVVAFVLPKKDWPFCCEDILVGIPGMADTELSNTMQEGDFILHYSYNKLDLVQCDNVKTNCAGSSTRSSIFQDHQKTDFVYIAHVNSGGMFPEKREALGKMRRVLESARDNKVTFAFKLTYLFERERKALGEIVSRAGRRANPKGS